MPKVYKGDDTVYKRTNIRRVRKWRKRRNYAPYLFLIAVFVFGIVVTFFVYRNS